MPTTTRVLVALASVYRRRPGQRKDKSRNPELLLERALGVVSLSLPAPSKPR